MSKPYPQQPTGQSAVPAAPAVPGAPAQPVQPAPEVVSQAGAPAQSAAPAQPAPQGAPQGYSVAPQGVPQMNPTQPASQGVPQVGVPVQPAPQGVPQMGPAQPAPQGFAPGYAPVPQGPVKVRVNYLSLVMGIGVWVFIALLVLDAWVEMHSPDASASGNDIFGFFPLFVLALGGPLNLIGVIVASSRAREKPTKWKLNRLAIILNVSPYIIFFVIMFFGLAVAPFFS